MKLTYEMAEKIFDMKKAGKSIKEISEELGVSDQTVRNRLKSAEEAKTEPEPEEAPAKGEETPENAEKTPEKAEKRPTFKMTIKTVIYKGQFGKYEVDDGDITLDVDYFPADKLPALIDELKALQEQLEKGV